MVKSFRIAILIFVIGASALNLLSSIRTHGDIGPAVATIPNPAWGDLLATPGPRTTPDPRATPNYHDPVYLQKLKEHRDQNMRFAEYEVVILTLAGIAWFLVSAKAKV